MKFKLIFVLLLISNVLYSQLDIRGFEQRSKRYYYYADVVGKIYFSNDSIAVYLYEPMMEYMVIYNLRSVNGVYIGYLPYNKKEVKLWRWHDVIFIEYKKVKTKLYLR